MIVIDPSPCTASPSPKLTSQSAPLAWPLRLTLLAVILTIFVSSITSAQQNLQGQPIRGRGSDLLFSPGSPSSVQFGLVIAAGDYNGDGLNDLIVGEPNATFTNIQDPGQVWFYDGGSSGLALPTVVLGTAGAHIGTAVVMADFDGDGVHEVVYSAPGTDVGPANNRTEDAGVLHYFDFSPLLQREFSQDNTSGTFSQFQDFFGEVMTAGDFDGDSYHDLAVGVPRKDTYASTPLVDAGAIVIFYGGPSGLPGTRTQVLNQDNGLLGTQLGENFGSALAAGDLNTDGYDDLVVGSPGRDESGLQDSGMVIALYGSSNGLAQQQTVSTSTFYVGNVDNGRFGEALAVGDFDFSLSCVLGPTCYDDLAVGWPGWIAPATLEVDHGAISLFRGGPTGIPLQSDFIQRPDLLPDATWSRDGERFGAFLSAGFFDTTIGVDLAIGLPHSRSEQGRLLIVPGAAAGLRKDTALLLDDGMPVPQLSAARNFGWSVVSGHFNDDGIRDLAIAIPNADFEGSFGAGAVEVLYNGCLFCDGFESGNTSLWDSSTP